MSPSVVEAASTVVDTGSSAPLGAAILPGGVNFTATFEES
jgi:hypothetical protein